MYILYLDEFGHAGIWDPGDPKHQHHPLFGLGGVCLEASQIKSFDRGFLRLKASFYQNEIRQVHAATGLRKERFEPKRLRSRRDRRFAKSVLGLVENLNGTVFARGVVKPVGNAAHNERALYTTTMQGLMQQYERFLRQAAGRVRGRGIIVLDERAASQDEILLASAQSFLYSAVAPFDRLVEAPLLVPSEWYHGVQAADSICRVIAALFRFRCANAANFAWAQNDFGAQVDRLNRPIGNWTTIFVSTPSHRSQPQNVP
jgi:hypothetical protein